MATDTEAPVEEIAGQTKAEFEEEAGAAVGDMPPAPPVDESVPVEELRVDGTTQLGIFDAGGKRPTGATLSLTNAKASLADGQAFKKGDVLRFEVIAVVREVGQKDKVDKKTGIVVECGQKHAAEVTDIELVSALRNGEEID